MGAESLELVGKQVRLESLEYRGERHHRLDL